MVGLFFFFNDTATTEIYTLSLHDALPICFVKTDDFGQLGYGSPAMNITFDPTVKGEFASYGFDDTGAVATREYLIKEGVLQRGLGSLESQARSGVNGVACARACSWNRPPIDRMANLNLEPGEASFEGFHVFLNKTV